MRKQKGKTGVRKEHTGASIAGEVGAPLDIGASSMLTSSDGVAADGAQNRRVGDFGAGGDDAVGDHVVEGRVLLLLDLIDGAVLEGPSEHIGLVVGALDDLRLGEGRPELGEVLKLDEVPIIVGH